MKKQAENDGDETNTEQEKSSDEEEEDLIKIDKIIQQKENLNVEDKLGMF